MDAKTIRSEIILNEGFRKYIRVKRALYTLVNRPENFVELLAKSKDGTSKIVVDILKANKNPNEIRKIIEIWTELDKTYGGGIEYEPQIA